MWSFIIAFIAVTMVVYGDDDILSKFIQHDYQVKNYRAQLKWFNPEYLNSYTVVTFKHNRSCAAINMTYNYKIDMDPDVDTLVQVYKLTSMQYRSFPIRFQVNIWRGVDLNAGGLGRAYDCGNLTRDHYIHKGVTYVVCNFVPDFSRMPPYIPSGEYMAEATVIYNSIEMATLTAFVEIFRN